MSTSKPSCRNHDLATEFYQLLSPEKGLYILYNLVEKNPELWESVHKILHPNKNNQGISLTESLALPLNRVNQVNQYTDSDYKDGEFEEKKHVSLILRNLKLLQLSQLPLDVLGVITSFLSLESCLKLTETSSFFYNEIPKYIDQIHLEYDITDNVYKLLYKVERLKYLCINGTLRMEAIPFLFPFDKLKTVTELILLNVNFVEKIDLNQNSNSNNKQITLFNNHKFDGGNYSLKDLQLICCENIDIEKWLKLTSIEHSPDLTSLTVKLNRKSSQIVHESPDSKSSHSMNEFMISLVSSSNHQQIINLNLTLYSSEILNCMKASYCSNLIKLEIGLMDRRFEEENPSSIRDLFHSLYTNRNNSIFCNLEILIIDFCPSHYSIGADDITPSDLESFCNSIPKVFPSLKLLSLLGSQRPLLFGDQHLNGLLNAFPLPQIIDLSLGFEDLSSFASDDYNIISDLLYTFPNLAWLTLDNDSFLNDMDKFQKMLQNIQNKKHLKWVTLCCASKDEIYELSNGIFIEYWDRGIEQCDFDMALKRSKQIINEKLLYEKIIKIDKKNNKSILL